MKFVQLKMLPLIGSMAMALMVAPGISLADRNDREHRRDHRAEQSERRAERREHRREHRQENRREHRREQQGSHRYNEYAHNPGQKYFFRHGHKKHHKHYKHKHKHHGHKHHVHKHHGHKHYKHRHGYHAGHHHGHYEPRYIVRDRSYRPYVDLSDLRFMFGLHTDNIDLIFRD